MFGFYPLRPSDVRIKKMSENLHVLCPVVTCCSSTNSVRGLGHDGLETIETHQIETADGTTVAVGVIQHGLHVDDRHGVGPRRPRGPWICVYFVIGFAIGARASRAAKLSPR